ncbi:MAG TPA: F0F1 ATP synthase subunit B [Rhizomicrobium sp.]|jgi:F-type H+-transporting ATPase subunit b
MADPHPTMTGTADTSGQAGFPPFHTTTYPSQIFWLAISFTLLLVFMWSFVVPRIGGTLSDRKRRIADEIAKAEQDRKEADHAWNTYQNTLLEARQRARGLVEDNRTHVLADVERAEKAADSEADGAIREAEARVANLRSQARDHIRRAAEDASISIVARLLGETVSGEEAAAAVRSVEV